jgi:hypothetical protein
MRNCRLPLASALLSLLLLTALAGAQYWFQSGVRAGASSAYNNGASVSIQTITPQTLTSGSMAFWVGENFANGAFLQVGYVIENQSGQYAADCTAGGCSGSEYIGKGDAEWFYEYFLPKENGTFMGQIGPDGSAGVNGTFNTYSFYSIGNVWYFLMNGKTLGSINIGTSSSGPYPPVALAELANTTGKSTVNMRRVIFANLSTYFGSSLLPSASGFGSVSYGVGSATYVPNPYGVQELGSRTNYFAVGSGLPLNTNNAQLWSLGYTLSVVSKYGNLSSKTGYVAYSTANLSAPGTAYQGSATRAVFKGWSGAGPGAYTGPKNNVSITLLGNVTETANWQLQQFVNVSSPFGQATGTGWYNNASVASYKVNASMIYQNSTARYAFSSWSNGNKNLSGTALVSGPLNLTAAWLHQYLVNVTAQYSPTTGSGWYVGGSTANISVVRPLIVISSGKRVAFSSWSNGNTNSSFSERVSAPLNISAIFGTQYRFGLAGTDAYGNGLGVSYFIVDGKQANWTVFLNANQTHLVSGAYYKGVLLPANVSLSANAPSNVSVSLPVYNVTIRTVDLFFLPVNATVSLTYRNLSSGRVFSGASGAVLVEDVPYGAANGTARYMGLASQVSVGYGKGATVIFVAPSNIAVIAIAAAVLAYIAVRQIRKKRAGGLQSATPLSGRLAPVKNQP